MKRLPCQYCAARGGKKHASDCRRPQTRPLKVTQAVAKPRLGHPTARPGEVMRNEIAIVVDRSGSMRVHRQKVQDVINAQVTEIKKNAAKLGQPTSLRIYSFNDHVSLDALHNDVFTFRNYDYQMPSGNTALFDGVGRSIEELEMVDNANNPNTSFLVIAITDGEENFSKRFKQLLPSMMRRVEATDRWTLVFSVPYGGRFSLLRLGIPAGNIQEWENTDAGLELMSRTTSVGISNYYDTRSRGITRTSNFFQPNMNAVSKKAIRNLDDLSRDFHVWNVDANSPIRDFVEGKLAQQPSLARTVGSNYQIGRGYYQLTKSEEVQAGKDMVILDKNTNALYGGDQARQLIGCPMNMSFKMKPGQMANYEIFVKSTSVNRKLIPGTKVLYFVG